MGPKWIQSPAIQWNGMIIKSGKATSNKSSTIFARTNGTTPLAPSPMLSRPMPQATLSTTPTGGVNNPTAVAITKIVPK